MSARDRAPPPTAEQREAIAANELRLARGVAYREGRLAEFDRMHGITRRVPAPPPEPAKRYVPAEVIERDARRAAARREWQAYLVRLDGMLDRAGFAPPDAVKPLVRLADDPLDAVLARRQQHELDEAAE